MNCEICHKSPHEHGVSVYRVNALGEIGIWRCEECLTPKQREALDPETVKLTKILERRAKEAVQKIPAHFGNGIKTPAD